MVDLAAKRLPVVPGAADEGSASTDDPAVAATEGAGPAPVRKNQFDNSGIRMLAVNGLLLQMDETLKHIESRDEAFRAEFGQLIEAWWKLAAGDGPPMVGILEGDTAPLSPVAAVALAPAGMGVGGEPVRGMLPGKQGHRQVAPGLPVGSPESLRPQE